MIELAQLNGVDWLIIVVLTVSTVWSLWRGFVREALSLLAWVAAFVVAHLFVDTLALQLGAVIANVTGRYVPHFEKMLYDQAMLVLAYIAQQLLVPEDRTWLESSLLMPHLAMLADWVQTVFANTSPGQQLTT